MMNGPSISERGEVMNNRTVVLAKPTYFAPGKLRLVGDVGTPVVVPFRAEFRRLRTSERRAVDEALAARSLTDADLVGKVLVGLEIADVTGCPAPNDAETRATLMEEYDGLEAAIVMAWFENNSANGRASEAEKNSEAPSAMPGEPAPPLSP